MPSIEHVRKLIETNNVGEIEKLVISETGNDIDIVLSGTPTSSPDRDAAQRAVEMAVDYLERVRAANTTH